MPLVWASPVSVMPFVAQGKVKALAISTQRRDPMLPQVPTVAESGVLEFDTVNWFGVVAPAKRDLKPSRGSVRPFARSSGLLTFRSAWPWGD
jgi:tripartite-type tricarboxylate transporter receptor subunit TctC